MAKAICFHRGFFVNNPDVLVKFEDDLYSVFSKDNLIRIAKRLKDNNGYDFRNYFIMSYMI